MIYDISYMIYDIWYIIYDIWYMIYHIWYIMFHITYIIHHIWYIIYHIWYIIYHISYMIYHISYIIYHRSWKNQDFDFFLRIEGWPLGCQILSSLIVFKRSRAFEKSRFFKIPKMVKNDQIWLKIHELIISKYYFSKNIFNFQKYFWFLRINILKILIWKDK